MERQPQPSASWPATASTPTIAEQTAPVVLRTLDDKVIAAFRGRLFAIPRSLGAVEQLDLTRDDNLPPGVIVADDAAGLIAELEYIARWADSRGQFDNQEAQRDGGSRFRAASALGEPEISVLESGFTIVRGKDGQTYAVRGEVADRVGRMARPAGEHSQAGDVDVIQAISDGVTMGVLGLINGHIVFELDQLFYAVPRVVVEAGARNEKLRNLPLYEQPGAVVAKTYPEVLSAIGWRRERRLRGATQTGASTTSAGVAASGPRIVRVLHGYNIVAYEGWFYGVPQSLGSVDLTETDALSLPGVIADVAQVAVETEIADRVAVHVGPA